jgi:hypothetical protein
VAGRVKSGIRGASLVALLYAVLNCPLPFFFLPLASWYTDALLGMVYVFLSFEPLRVTVLAVLGCVFSGVLFLILLNFRRKRSALSGS